MSVPTTPNLGLNVPASGSYDQIPQWGQLLNANFEKLDQAVPSVDNPLTPALFDVNTDVPFNGFEITQLGAAKFQDRSDTPTGLTQVYFKNSEMWATDSNGNQVQITSGGNVNAGAGSITGLPSSPAGAGVAWNNTNGSFDFLGASGNVRPTLQTGPLKVFDTAAGPPANGVSLKSPSALAASYALTFPAATPASPAVVKVDAAGTLTFVKTAPAGANPTYGTNWNGTVVYWKDLLGYVHFSGHAVKGSGSVATMFTLPSGFWPVSEAVVPVGADSAILTASVAAVRVSAAGVFTLQGAVTTGFTYYFSFVTYFGV